LTEMTFFWTIFGFLGLFRAKLPIMADEGPEEIGRGNTGQAKKVKKVKKGGILLQVKLEPTADFNFTERKKKKKKKKNSLANTFQKKRKVMG